AGGPVSLTVEVAPEMAELFTDRVKLREIVQNLVDNAVKFTAAGSVTIAARPGPGRGGLTIDVVDTGPGMAPEEVAHTFEPFFPLGESRTRTTGGMGLGLSIVRELVGVLGGEITAASHPGQGTCFTVTLPRRLPAVDGTTPASHESIPRRVVG